MSIQATELYSDDVEKGCLGSILIDSNFYPLVARQITDKDFFFVRNQVVFRAMKRCWQEFGAIDSSLLIAKIMEDQQGRAFAGDGYPNHAQVYLYSLVEGMVSSYYAETYALLIKRYSVRRALLVASENITALARNVDMSVEDVLSSSVAQIHPIAEGLNTKITQISPLFDAYLEQATRESDDRYIPTPYPSLNQASGGGVRRGNYSILTGVPGAGKTLIASHYAGWLATQVKSDGSAYRIGFYSIEMNATRELMPRILSGQTRLTLNQCERPSGNVLSIILDAGSRLHNHPLWIDDSAEITAEQIRLDAEIRRYDLIIIDYAQIMSSSMPTATRYEQMNQTADIVKIIAKDTDCGILLLAQMNTQGATAKAGKFSQSTIEGTRKWNQAASAVWIMDKKDGTVYISNEKSRFSEGGSINTTAVPTIKPLKGTAHYEDLGFQIANSEFENYNPSSYL